MSRLSDENHFQAECEECHDIRPSSHFCIRTHNGKAKLLCAHCERVLGLTPKVDRKKLDLAMKEVAKQMEKQFGKDWNKPKWKRKKT